MSFREMEDLAIAYLLNELSDEQRADFEERMEKDSQLSQLLDELEESMGLTLLAESELIEPDIELKQRLLSSVPDKPQSKSQEQEVIPFPFLKVSLASLGWVAAVILVFVLVSKRTDLEKLQRQHQEAVADNEQLQERVEDLSNSVEAVAANNRQFQDQIEQLSENISSTTALNQELQTTLDSTLTQNENLQSSLDSTQQANETLRAEMEALATQLAEASSEREDLENVVASLRKQSVLDKIQIAALNSEVDELRYGFAVWDKESDRGILKVFHLASLDASQDYQCWVISPEREAPIPAGVFQVDSLGRANFTFASSMAVTDAGAVAISLEPKGGSSAPTGPIVLSGAL
ncbi:MAG: anti-sigma factor [Verrucomicrobiae bacterium]|nr:anti-sigma factor [Verrucomicrobiae bacterium]